MKVLDLRCANGHGFEGWFGSDDDFLDQNGRGLVECPMCADRVVSRLPSAPRLNLSGAREPAAPPAKVEPAAADLQALWMQAVRHAIENTDDVGERFANVARQMHYGEVEERGIRGCTTPKQAMELLEEGIGVMPLPPSLNEPLQ
jgi:hypothetical protein